MSSTEERLAPLVRAFERAGVRGARVGLVLGSGLGAFAQRLAGARSFPYAELEGMPRSSVPGHAGRLVLGEVGGVRVAVLEGRVHRYEGRSAEEVTRAVRALAALEVGALVLTNAAGGLDASWRPPLLMRITDHVDMQRTPLFFPSAALQEGSPRAPMSVELQRASGEHRHPDDRARENSSLYDSAFGRAIELEAREAGIPLVHGIYAGLLGPSYETPAEVQMLRWLGASAVGMSTVAEAAATYTAGCRVAGISCITNAAAGLAQGPLSHEEVVAAGVRMASALCTLLERCVPRIAAELGSTPGPTGPEPRIRP